MIHFEITKCKILLGKGLPTYNTQKSYTPLDHTKGLKFGILAHHHRISLSAPLQPLNHIHLQI